MSMLNRKREIKMGLLLGLLAIAYAIVCAITEQLTNKGNN